MKLLLTSGGITNTSIRNALVGLLGKPIAEAKALIIPTAAYWFSRGPEIAYRLISGTGGSPMTELGWKSLGVLELTALSSIEKDAWIPQVRETDALLVGGGDPMYLCDWMRKSGFAELIPSLRPELVYVGISGGSQAVTFSLGDSYNGRIRAATARSASSTSRWACTWITRTCPTTQWPSTRSGRPGILCRRTRSTIRAPSRSSRASSR